MNNPTQSFPGSDDIIRDQLKNGITVLIRSNFNSPSVFISGYLSVGSLFDSDEKLGLADFTASALMRGTAQHNFQQIYDALESVGASLGFGGGTHTTNFSGKALTEDLDLLLQLMSEALREPVFPAEHIEKLRAMFLTGLAIRNQNTEEMASLTLDQILYKDHPYSRPEDGYPETISAIDQTEIIEFHKNNYGPRNMVIVVVGAVDPLLVMKKIERTLGDWRNPLQPDVPALPGLHRLEKTIQKKITIPGKSQADILLGVPGPERAAPDYLAASLGNSVLGQFGMFGRLGEVIREKEGLAYYAYSSLSGGLGPGPWSVSAGVDLQNIERTIKLILNELEKIVIQPVSQDELEDSQANFIGRLPLSLESNAGVAGALLNLERYQLGLDYYRIYPELVRTVTKEDILQVFQKYINPQKVGIAVAGSKA